MKNKRILVLGARGQLGEEFVSFLSANNYNFLALAKSEANICDEQVLQKLFADFKPDIVINCAAYNQVDLAEDNKDLAYAVNSEALKSIAKLCNEYNSFLVHYSSDYVFDGNKDSLYLENDLTAPLNVYGCSKLEGENVVKGLLNDYLIFRLSWVIGRGKHNFLYKLQEWAKGRVELRVVDDEISVPTFTDDVVKLTFQALDKNLKGLYHLCSSEACSRYDLAKKYFAAKQSNIRLLRAKRDDFDLKAIRPACSAMSNGALKKDLGIDIEKWDVLLERFLKSL